MTVKEIQAMAPKAEVYELSSDTKYLILMDEESVPFEMASGLQKMLKVEKIRGVLAFARPGAIRILELGE